MSMQDPAFSPRTIDAQGVYGCIGARRARGADVRASELRIGRRSERAYERRANGNEESPRPRRLRVQQSSAIVGENETCVKPP